MRDRPFLLARPCSPHPRAIGKTQTWSETTIYISWQNERVGRDETPTWPRDHLPTLTRVFSSSSHFHQSPLGTAGQVMIHKETRRSLEPEKDVRPDSRSQPLFQRLSNNLVGRDTTVKWHLHPVCVCCVLGSWGRSRRLPPGPSRPSPQGAVVQPTSFSYSVSKQQQRQHHYLPT